MAGQNLILRPDVRTVVQEQLHYLHMAVPCSHEETIETTL